MSLENDINISLKAVSRFVETFNGSYKNIGGVLGFKIYDKNGTLISYSDVLTVDEEYSRAKQVKTKAARLIKLSDKKLNPVLLWAFKDGVLYCKTKNITGSVEWIPNPMIPPPYNSPELFVISEQTPKFKFIKY